MRELEEFRDSPVTPSDTKQRQFVEYLLASSDYEVFYRVMMREGAKVHLPCGNPKCGTCALKAGRPLPIASSESKSISSASGSPSKQRTPDEFDDEKATVSRTDEHKAEAKIQVAYDDDDYPDGANSGSKESAKGGAK